MKVHPQPKEKHLVQSAKSFLKQGVKMAKNRYFEGVLDSHFQNFG